MQYGQGMFSTGQDQTTSTDEVRTTIESNYDIMTSCAFPSQATISNVWSIDGGSELSTPQLLPPGQEVQYVQEDEASKILDFEKLENDLMKNVLGEENFEIKRGKCNGSNLFPSFNYLPVPVPANFTKSNSAIKLHSKNQHSTSLKQRQDKHQHRSSQRQRSVNLEFKSTTSNCNKSNDRRKLNNAKQYAKILERDKAEFDKQSAKANIRDKPSSKHFKKSHKNQYRKSSPKEFLQNRSQHPVTITIARRKPGNVSPVGQATLFEASNAFGKIARCSIPGSKKELSGQNDVKSDVLKTNQPNLLTQKTARNIENRQQNGAGLRSGASRRNFASSQTRGDQKKRKIGEKTVKTFAQIVATGSTSAKRYSRFQE